MRLRTRLATAALAAAALAGLATTAVVTSQSAQPQQQVFYHADGQPQVFYHAANVTHLRLAANRYGVENNGVYYFINMADGGYLHGHAHGSVLTDADVAQTWVIQNGRTVSGYYWVQVRLNGTSLCANASVSLGEVFLDSCAIQDSEFFYVPGAGNDNFFIPYVEQGDYWTDQGAADSYLIWIQPAGHGLYAQWEGSCQNC